MATRLHGYQTTMATEEEEGAHQPPRTSDFYRTKNIPERFDRPGKQILTLLSIYE